MANKVTVRHEGVDWHVYANNPAGNGLLKHLRTQPRHTGELAKRRAQAGLVACTLGGHQCPCTRAQAPDDRVGDQGGHRVGWHDAGGR